MNSKTFCPFPWIHFSVRTNGDFRVCCQANQGPTQGILKKNNGENFNLKNDLIGSHINCNLLKNIRRDALNGTRNPECIRCWREEDSKISSRRLTAIDEFQNLFTETDALTVTDKKDGTIIKTFEPTYYDLRFGNTCNLKCRICGPADSNSWYNETINLYNKESFHDSHGLVELVKDCNGNIFEKNDDYGWHKNEKFWKNLEEKIPHLDNLYLVGGEPLLIERHFDFLQKCIDLNQSDKITLNYNTNLTILNSRTLGLWKKFKKVQIGASIDSFGNINEYIRYPSKWSKIEKNIFKLDNLISESIDGWLTTTVSIFNVYNMTDFLTWHIKSGIKNLNTLNSRNPCTNFHMLHRPYHLNVKTLPISIKIKVREQYKEYYNFLDTLLNNKKQKMKIIKKLDSIIDFMFKDDMSEHFSKFLNVTKRLDQSRNQNLSTSIPALSKLISDWEKDQ